MAIREADGDVTGALYRHVACCVDGSPESGAALTHARALWSPEAGRLSVVHVSARAVAAASIEGDPVPRVIAPPGAAVRPPDEAEGVPGAVTVPLEGLPGPELCEWAERAGVNLLVSAAHGGGAPMAVLSEVTRYLVEHAPCPVLVVRRVPARS